MIAAAGVAGFLQEAWYELRNGANTASVQYVVGAIDIAHAVKLMSDEHAELWKRRIKTCPGHSDESGRDWCAFCGTLPRKVAGDFGSR